jgi:hypothetical protein
MRTPSFRLLRRVIVYLIGAFLIGWGLCCLGYEGLFPTQMMRDAMEANKALFIYAPSMFSGVIVCWGVLLVVATYSHYRGGVWTPLGAALMGLSMIFGALGVDTYSTEIGHSPRSTSVMILVTWLAAAAFVFLLGFYSLAAGHIRHRRMQRESPPPMKVEGSSVK